MVGGGGPAGRRRAAASTWCFVGQGPFAERVRAPSQAAGLARARLILVGFVDDAARGDRGVRRGALRAARVRWDVARALRVSGRRPGGGGQPGGRGPGGPGRRRAPRCWSRPASPGPSPTRSSACSRPGPRGGASARPARDLVRARFSGARVAERARRPLRCRSLAARRGEGLDPLLRRLRQRGRARAPPRAAARARRGVEVVGPRSARASGSRCADERALRRCPGGPAPGLRGAAARAAPRWPMATSSTPRSPGWPAPASATSRRLAPSAAAARHRRLGGRLLPARRALGHRRARAELWQPAGPCRGPG